MKKRTSLLLSVVMVFTLCTPAFAADTHTFQFADVSGSSWYAPYVETACASGLMNGTGGANFSPGGNLTVAAAITLAARLHNTYHGNGADLKNGDPWYQPYVDYASQNGILDPGRSYSYGSSITRADFALLISNALPDSVLPAINDIQPGDIPGVSSGSPMDDALNALADAGVVKAGDSYMILLMSAYLSGLGTNDTAGEAVCRLYRAGILTGNDGYGTFAPYTNIKRSEVAAIVSRVVDASQRKHVQLERKPVELVPMNSLANRSSLQERASGAELAQAYEKAREIVEPLANLSVEAQLYGIALAVRVITENEVEYSMSAPHYSDPYGFFVLHTASCAGCTRATGLCLNMLGISYEHVNPNQYTHQWTRINVNGTYWICDAYGLYCGPEPAPYQHPLL